MAGSNVCFALLVLIVTADFGDLFLLDRSSYSGNGESKYEFVFFRFDSYLLCPFGDPNNCFRNNHIYTRLLISVRQKVIYLFSNKRNCFYQLLFFHGFTPWYNIFSFYRVNLLPYKPSAVFTCYRVYLLPCLPYAVFTFYRVYLVPRLP